MAVVKRYRVYGVEVVPSRAGGFRPSLYEGQWKVGYRNLNPRTGAPWQSYKTKYFATEAAAWTWVRAHSDGLGQARHKVAGRARSRGGLSIPEERERRRVDARLQPRTPVTRQRFFFKSLHRKPAPRRRPLDEEARREYEERYQDLEYGIEGLTHAIGALKDEIDTAGFASRKRDYRHVPKTRVHQYSPTGRRLSQRPAGDSVDAAIDAARARLRELTADYRAQRREQNEVADILKYGEKPGHYRKRLARRGPPPARRRGR